MHQVYVFKLVGATSGGLEVYASVEARGEEDALSRIREALTPHAGGLAITGPSEAYGAVISVRVNGITQASIFAVDGVILDPFKEEEEVAQIPPEDLERAWDMRKECYETDREPRCPDDYSDDGQALASAGWGSDEDYFLGSCD